MTSTQHTFDMARAAEHYRATLLRIVDMLFALIGFDETAAVATLPRCTRNHVLRILRPAESAARRLIVVAARRITIVVRPSSERKEPPPHSVILGLDAKTSGAPSLRAKTDSVKPATAAGKREIGRILYLRAFREVSGMGPRVKPEDDARCGASRPTRSTAPNLSLLDPLKRFDFGPARKKPRGFPRISIIGVTEPRPIPEYWIPSPGDPVSAHGVCRRLHVLKRALDDLDGQAKRLARWRAKARPRRQPLETPLPDAARLAAGAQKAGLSRNRHRAARPALAGVPAVGHVVGLKPG
jgi:hypothetical protein